MRTAAYRAIGLAFAIGSALGDRQGDSQYGGPRQGASSKLYSSSFDLPSTDKTFDYVVVGGGTAGLTVALRLAESRTASVAVVEAGGFYEIDAGNFSEIPAYESLFTQAPPSIDWKIFTTHQSQLGDRSVFYSQGKCLGGSTCRNGMAYQRGTISSYQLWADAVGDQSFVFSNLLQYFKKSVKFTPPNYAKRGGAPAAYDSTVFNPSGGPLEVSFWNYFVPVSQNIRDGLQKLGFLENGNIQSGSLLGFAQFPATVQAEAQIRDSSETSFLQTAIRETDLQVYQRTLAKKILFNGKTATGVLVNTAGLTYTLSARKEVVLAAGPFRSPQLLMVSGVGPAAKLQQLNIPVVADLPGVGQNFSDHPGYGTLYPVNAVSQHRLFSDATYAAKAYEQFYADRSGPLTAFASNYLLWEHLPNTTTLSASTHSDLAAFPSDWPDVQYIFNCAGPPTNNTGDFISIGVVLMKPTSRGSVTINSTDTADNPLVDVQWFASSTDQEVGVKALERVRVFANAAGVISGPEIMPGPGVQTDAQILDWVKSAAIPSHHAVGSCKMGRSSDAFAVVDSKGHVLGGISHLRIVDASIMPLLPPGQPMSTVYMIAEKLAEDILNGN